MWERHLAAGFFGFSPGETPQPRWQHVPALDWDEVGERVGDVLAAWWRWLPGEDVAQPFPGAVEEWPRRLADGLAVCRREWAAIQQHHQHLAHEAQKRRPR